MGAAFTRRTSMLEAGDWSFAMGNAHPDLKAAARYIAPSNVEICDDPRARCGEVLTGKCKPHQCPLFGNTCNPQTAFGALMVSSEGACAAWYQYRQQESEA